MDLYEAMRGRRSIRRYQQDRPPREVLEKIFDAALWAPSGMNRQNWRFYVLTGERKDELVRICSASIEYLEPVLQERFADKPKIIESTRKFFQRLGGAPVVICAYFEPGPGEEIVSYQNVAAAIQNLLLAAYAEGLGTCWMTGPVHVAAEINRYLGIEDLTLVAVIPIGYPDESPKPPPRRPERVVYLGFSEEG